MKRKLTLLIALLMCLCVVFVLVSCGGTDTDTNTESQTDTEAESNTDTESETDTETNTETDSTTESETETETETETDTDTGSESDVSSETDTDTVTDTDSDEPEHIHTEEIIPAVEPTCTETGSTEGKKCSTCGEILVAQNTVNALGHKYENSYSCTVCGEALAPSEGLAYKLSDDGTYYIVTGIDTCTDVNIVIPSTYNDLPVTTIDEAAFKHKTTIKSVILPDSISSIGNDAFAYCTSLKNVTIPNSVTYIGDYAFTGCSSLVCNEYDNAYYLGNKENPYFVLLKAKNESVTFCNINEITKFIHSHAFEYCAFLAGITIPDSITSIGYKTFEHCTLLESVKIGNSVTSIGEKAFYFCTSLTEIYFNAKAMDDLSSSNNVFYKAGQNGDGIKVTIGKEVTKIPACLFYPYSDSSYSPKITSVVFEDNSVCESIGKYAFSSCSSLKSLTIGNSVTYIEEWAFAHCTSLTGVEIPDCVISIGSYAFYGCASLKSTTIGNGVTSIKEWAFSSCTSLKSVTIGSSVTSIKSYAFAYCTSLENVIIGSGVKFIESHVFYNCSSLASVTFENTNEWYVTTGGATVNITVTNASTNATNLKDTYYNCYWQRK